MMTVTTSTPNELEVGDTFMQFEDDKRWWRKLLHRLLRLEGDPQRSRHLIVVDQVDPFTFRVEQL